MRLTFTPEGEPYYVPETDEEAESVVADEILRQEAESGQPSRLRVFINRKENIPLSDAPSVNAPASDLPPDEDVELAGLSQELEELIAPPTDFLDIADQATAGLRRFGKGAHTAATSVALDLPSTVLGVMGKAKDAIGIPNVDSKLAQELNTLSEKSKAGASKFLGVEGKPNNTIEELAELSGENIVPAKQYTVPVSAALTGLQYGAKNLVTPAEASSKKPLKPNVRNRGAFKPTQPVKDDVVKMLEKAARKGAPNEYTNLTAPDVVKIIETVGGPKPVREADYEAMGYIAAISAGAIFAPWLFSKFKFNRLPRLRDVENVPVGTKAISTVGDYARTVGDDVNAGLINMANRAGVNPQVIEKLQNTFRIQTRTAANALTDAAVTYGKMNTPSFTFLTRVPISEQAKRATPDLARYLHLKDTGDDLLLLRQQAGANAGPPTIRGMTIPDVLRELNAMERANPNLRQLAKDYTAHLKDVRNYLGKGEYSLISAKDLRFLNASRSNTVPMDREALTQKNPFSGARTTGEDIERGDPFVNMAEAMRNGMRFRMENEAKGLYVDEMRKVNPDLFQRVTHKDLQQNPRWKKNTIEFYRRGEKEIYVSDVLIADTLRMDPYYFNSFGGQVLYGSKRLFEIGTTGALAPWFAVVNAMRTVPISKFTSGDMKAPGVFSTIAAIPQQLTPQIARAISESLTHGSGQWLTNVFGKANIDALSTRLAIEHDKSFYALMQTAGTHRGAITEQQIQASNKFTQAIQSVPPQAKAWLTAYKSMLDSVHNAPQYAFAKKNQGRLPLPELMERTRNLTGNPRIGGEFYSGERPIRFEGDTKFSSALASIAKGYGYMSEGGRMATPWFNAMVQGGKRIGQAYVENPAKFTGQVWMYVMAPAAAGYSWNASLGKDPNGLSYVDYQMNRRSPYNQIMSQYIAIPGRPAEEGIELPIRFHELAGAARAMEVAMDHLMGSPVFSKSEDYSRLASSLVGVAASPAVPPLFNAVLATQGMSGVDSFLGDSFKRRKAAFDQTDSDMASSLELTIRALAGGVADYTGAYYHAYSQTPAADGTFAAIKHGVKDSTSRIVSKTPALRDVLNIHAPMTGNTDISKELMKKQRSIDELLKYYKFDELNERKFNTDPVSKGGGEIVKQLLGEGPPESPAGILSGEPTNPLYKLFAEEVYNKFKKDAPLDNKNNPTGAIGFRSVWRRYGDYKQHLDRIRNTNSGNYVTWKKQLEEDHPDQIEYLENNGVNINNINEVRNFYERKRQDVSRVLLQMIRAVELDMSQRLGEPIKLEQLDPYGKGLEKASLDRMVPEDL